MKTHESIWFSEYGGFDDEEERELLDAEPERFIRLPSKYEIHEYSIMEDTVNRMGIAKQWYDYQENAHREVAIRWCRDNEYEYWEE